MSENRFALIIANDQYEDESLSKLDAPKFDAYALAEVLGDPGTCNFYVQLVVNKQSHTVIQFIEAFFDNRKRDDLLLLYFSGHGLKDEDGQLYFATPNTKRNRLLSTAVAASFVNQLMRRTRSRRQILLLDCCYSGAFAKGMIAKSGSAIGSVVGTNEQFQGRGRVVLTASDSMQYAFEEDKLVEKGSVNSIFTSALVEGIKTWEADSNNDNRITIHELYDFIDGYVQDRTPNQQPVMWSFNTRGEMIIAEREYTPLMEDEEIEVYVPKPQQLEETQPSVEVEQQPMVIDRPSLEMEPTSMEVEQTSQAQSSTEIMQPDEVEQPPVEIAQEEVELPSQEVQPASETVQPLKEQEQPTFDTEQPTVEVVQQSFETEHPPVELEQVEIEHPIEDEQQTVEAEQPPIETPPPSPVQVSTELVKPTLEEPTDKQKIPVKPLILVAIILVAFFGIAFWLGLGPFDRKTEDEDTGPTGGGSSEMVPVIDYFLTTAGSTLRWSVSNATSVSIDQGIGSVELSGSTTVSPDETSTYTLTATNGDRSVDATVQVIVEETRDPVVEYFTIDGSTLMWSISDANSIYINNGIGDVASSGSTTVLPDETTTYTLTAINMYGVTYAFVTVVVEESTLPNVIKIGYIAASPSGLDTVVPLVQEIITPDLNAYANSLGFDISFEFIIESADSQATVHLQKVQELKAMGVDIFIGGPWSSMAQGSLSYVNENDMLMVSASSTSPLLAIENDRLFRICPTDYVQARTIAEMWDSWGADAVLIIQRRDSWGDGIYNLLVPELEARGITIIGRVRYSVDTTDFKSYLNTMDSLLENAIAEYGVERVGVQTMMFDEIVDLVSLTSAFPNTRKVIWMGTETSGRNQKMIDEAGGKQVELKMFSAIMEPPSSSEWESFESRYYALTSQSAGFYTATAYDAAWILAKSIIQTGSLDASKIADAFPDVSDSHYGVSGLTNLDKNGDREPGHFNIWGYADNSYGFTLYGTFDGNTNNLVWDDEELTNQGVSRPGLTE